MKLLHYLLMAAFHLVIFTTWARGNEPVFVVENKVPAFVVENKTVPASEMPPAAPAGFEWKRYPGQPWKLHPVVQAPTSPYVAQGGQPYPFAYGPPVATHAFNPAGTGAVTTVRYAGLPMTPPTSSGAGVRRGGRTGIPIVFPGGTSGCPTGFG